MKKTLGLLMVLAALAVIFMPLSGSSHAAGLEKTCNQYSVPVQLQSTGSTTYNVVGWLCYRGSLTGKTLEVLVPGATYDHNYWDFPYNNGQYSFVDYATAAGFATFNIDKLGTGLSDHPAPELLTVETDAYWLHGVIQDLRSGDVNATNFSKIIVVGHSLGSEIADFEAGTYNDEDGVIITGFLHALNTNFLPLEITDIIPAAYDPKFSSDGYPLGYLTSVSGTRGQLFYNTSFADPNVIALDEQLKSTATDGEFGTFADGLTATITKSIKAPVLVVVGEDDSIFCLGTSTANCNSSSGVLSNESPWYTSAKSLQAFSLPLSGHDVNLHYDSPAWYAYGIGWAYSQVVF